MKKIIYKLTGEIDKSTKQFPAILFRSRERNKNIIIGNSPVIVSNDEYKILKDGKHGKDIMLVKSIESLPKPLEIDISGPKIKAKLGIPKAILKAGKKTNRTKSKKKKTRGD